MIRAVNPDWLLEDVAFNISEHLSPSNLSSYLAGVSPFPVGHFPTLMKLVPDPMARARLGCQFRSARAAHKAKLAVRREGRLSRAGHAHTVHVRPIRSKTPATLREARVYEIMERSAAYQELHKGALLSLTWKNLPDLLVTLVDIPRREQGEEAARSNATALFDTMRSLPVENASDSLSAINLAYRTGDLIAQFDDWDAIEMIRAQLRRLRKEVKGDDGKLFCDRMLDEYASLQSNRTASDRLKFAAKAMNRFKGKTKRFTYLSQDFKSLHYGWASTFFNYIQVAMPTARTESRLQALRDVFDRGLESLGMEGSMSEDAAALKAPDPYRAQLIGAQELSLAQFCHDREIRHAHIDKAIAMTDFALNQFGQNYRQGGTIVAQLRVDHAAALLHTYNGERKWPIASRYAAARKAAATDCAEAACFIR
jgi:hypothetical protein